MAVVRASLIVRLTPLRLNVFAALGLLCFPLTACLQQEGEGAATSRQDSTEGPPQENRVVYYSPDWSPDGTRIVFSSDRDGNPEIYTIRPDGSELVRLTNNEFGDGEPAWAPYGTRLAYASRGAIYVMNSDGTNPERLTDSIRATAPAWSPGGSKIAFEGRVEGNNYIFVMNSDGSSVTRLTQHEANDFRPSWSPDGIRIAFNSKRGGSYDLYTMNADGSNIDRLTEMDAHEVSPAWSPDGFRLLFARVIEGEEGVASALYTLDLATATEIRLGASSPRGSMSSWSPDGQRIAYLSGETDDMALSVMDADGSNPVQLLPSAR